MVLDFAVEENHYSGDVVGRHPSPPPSCLCFLYQLACRHLRVLSCIETHQLDDILRFHHIPYPITCYAHKNKKGR